MKNLVSASQLQDKKLLETLFARSDEFSNKPVGEYPQVLKNFTVASVFFEPSTRTRLSFETAAQNLGANIITVENGSSSSFNKGESLEDTIKMLNAYAEAIVMRHPEVGAAERAAKVTEVPFINAGDGSGEHPTQALLDLYTIRKAKGELDGLKIGLVGDLLNGRTVHSLVQLLSMYDVELFFISPKALQMPEAYSAIATKNGGKVHTLDSWDKVLDKLDVLYMTRVQKERFKLVEEYLKIKDSFILDGAAMKKFNPNGIVMHPLPRVNEITTEVDADPRAMYFQQARNGLYVRMALLEHIFEA